MKELEASAFNAPNLEDLYASWSKGAVSGAPWGAPGTCTIHYNTVYDPDTHELTINNVQHAGLRTCYFNAGYCAGAIEGGKNIADQSFRNHLHSSILDPFSTYHRCGIRYIHRMDPGFCKQLVGLDQDA